jgi:hypothetical protein
MSGCPEVQEFLLAVARAETVTAADQRTLREHVETCVHCRRRLANERMLSAGLAAMAAEPAVPSASVRSALLTEFRREKKVVPIRLPLVKPSVKWVAIAAVAAAVLMAVVLAKWPRKEPVVATPSVQVVKTPPPVPVIAPPEQAPVQVKARPAMRPRPRPVAPPPAQVDDEPEVATDFFEIPYVEPLRPEQRADVFRMQVPRASMAAFGLPVTGGRLDSRVTADVLMGEDGVVRAVRFIR